ncbi:MAG: GNAT family N-acetyltransferase, partial [Patulibacter sp.]|nr:GNAT family N-acetyltransferase [Patulibacter sp.]
LAEPWDNVVFVAEHGGRVIGVAAWLLPRGPNYRPARDARLGHLYVHPSVQGAGLGRRLLTHAEDGLRQVGGETAQAAVHEGNTWTAALLASAGWARRPDTLDEMLPRHRWTRKL